MKPQELWDGYVPDLSDVFRARRVIRDYLKPTPAIESPALSERFGCRVIVKCENLQPIGAFKIRGGIYLLSQLPAADRKAGVVAASTGNHGQSIAYAARLFGVAATIFVPNGANPLKVAAMERLGATIRFAFDDFIDCHSEAERYARAEGKFFIHSANVPELIAGVGTASLEVIEEFPDLDAIFVAVGGGSGACGACITAKTISPDIRVIGVQAEGAPAVYESWRDREIKKLGPAQTFAEGIAVSEAFTLPARIMWDMLDDFVLVSDAGLKRSMLTLLETTRMLAEGAGAAALAGLHARRHDFEGKTVAVVLSGGNLTLETLEQALTEERPW
ncbi:MAG TPA: threonine/serine dehydratase [Thermomicrobiales bacterium]|nr:threonine/serine dehydratase [Thermomicrobiales bacterium]